MIPKSNNKRGALIVLEGCDRAGKSTQANLLVEALAKNNKDVQHMRFPDRTTAIGKVIDNYLKCETELSDQAIHLLYSANRWELVPKINSLLTNGTTIIVDRYAFSGVAYTAAKGLDLEWCKNPEIGLPKPDIVFFLNLSQEEASARGDYGKERYENLEFQEKVKNLYFKLKDDSFWKIIEANRQAEEVHQEILKYSLKTIKENEGQVVKQLLWK